MIDTVFPCCVHPEAPWTESLEATWDGAQTYAQFLPTAQKNEGLWTGIWERATIPDDILRRVDALQGRWRLLVLSADWCGDASNTVPVLAKLAEAAANLDLRVIERDDHPDLMDAHLTNGRSRSIPVALVVDEEGRERGWWGPRPSELQTWVMEEGLKLESAERYKHVRRWYARDRGRTTLEEVVGLLESVA